MKKQMTGLFFLSIFILIIFIQNTYAKPYIYESKIPHNICSGIRSSFIFYLKNNADQSNNFNISVNSTNNELVWIPHSVKLIPGDSIKIYVFANPKLNETGNSKFKLSARYGNKIISTIVNYRILNCNQFLVKINKNTQYCLYSPIKITGEISNKGEFNNQTIILSSSLGKINKREITLNKNQTKSFVITINPFKKIGNKTLVLKLIVKNTNQIIIKKINLPIESCSSFKAYINSKNNSVCANSKIKYYVYIKNNGKIKDSYTINSNVGMLNKTKFNLNPNESINTSLMINPKNIGEYPLIVDIHSKYGLKKELVSQYNVKNCCGISLVTTPSPITICSNELMETAVSMGLLNIGNSANYSITSDASWAIPSIHNIYLKNNSEKTFLTRINPMVNPGEYRAIIKAKSNGCEDTAYITLKVKNCYNFAIKTNLKNYPLINKMCSCSSKPFKITVFNKGVSKDSYNLGLIRGDPRLIKFNKQDIIVNAGQSGYFKVNLTVPCSYNKTSEIVFRVSSNSNPSLSKDIKVKISGQRCYGVNAIMNNIKICPNKEFNLTALITNMGNKTDTYNLKLNCPNWIKSESNLNKITLEPNEKKIIKFYGKANISDASNTFICALEVKSKSDPTVFEIASSNIKIKPIEQCFCFKPTISNQSVKMKAGKTKVVSVLLKNCGKMTEDYHLNIIGNHSEWIVSEPNSLSLKHNEIGKFYLALLPSLNAKIGSYNYSIEINGMKSKIIKNLKFNLIIR